MQVLIQDSWDELLECFGIGQKDVYFSEAYVRLAAGTGRQALCAVCTEGSNVMLMPFLRGEYRTYFDFETPYGYGGPISNTADAAWNTAALKELFSCFASQGYLAGFVRFHPLLNNADMCRDLFPVIDDRRTVAVNTSVSEDEIWTGQLSSKNRNMIRKAEKHGLEFFRDDDFACMDAFKRLYCMTMDRLGADGFYYFSDGYYRDFARLFRGKGFIGGIRQGTEIVSAALFMYEGPFGHYHLAGSSREHAAQGANNLLLWKTACELHREGVKEFHLGGGTDSSEENSLFCFKKSFSPDTRQFSIGKLIFNEAAYNDVCTAWAAENPGKIDTYGRFLLKYRY